MTDKRALGPSVALLAVFMAGVFLLSACPLISHEPYERREKVRCGRWLQCTGTWREWGVRCIQRGTQCASDTRCASTQTCAESRGWIMECHGPLCQDYIKAGGWVRCKELPFCTGELSVKCPSKGA
jgi:hypothetical protein